MDKDTRSDFLLAFSPAKCSLEWLGNLGKALYELSIMTHEAEEGPNLCVSLWWYIFHDGLYIDITGPNTSL